MKNLFLFVYCSYIAIRLLIKFMFGIGKKSVYIAGKISGLSADDVKTKFFSKEIELISKGYFVVNPMRLTSENPTWTAAMKIDLMMLSLCDFIWLLPDYEDSEGARMEAKHAGSLRIENISQHTPQPPLDRGGENPGMIEVAIFNVNSRNLTRGFEHI